MIELVCALALAAPVGSAAGPLIGWNNLGMHCMDSDFSVFAILPPYNTIHAQLIDASGTLMTDTTGIEVTYQAVADPDGSLNTSSVGKTNFWDSVQALFGVALLPDTGLPVPGPNSFLMPGAANTPMGIALRATDQDGDALTLRIVSQAAHGTVGLVGTTATYYPETDYAGSDSFTFAAGDGQTDSNLGTVTLAVSGPEPCSYSIAPATLAFPAAGGAGLVSVTTAGTCAWTATSNAAWIHLAAGAAGSGTGTVNYTVDANPLPAARSGTVTVAGRTFTATQAPAAVPNDVTGIWLSLTTVCRTPLARCQISGVFTVRNPTPAAIPRTRLAVYLSSSATLEAATLLRTFSVRALRAGKSGEVRLRISLPRGLSTAGKYVVAVVDAGQVLPGDTTANNVIPYGPLP